jgi:LysM repeat protein
MKWRHWSILIILVLLNYIIFSTAFNIMAEQRRAEPRSIRTPQPTFESTETKPVAWIILPTSTQPPTRIPFTPSPTTEIVITASAEVTTTVEATTIPQDTATVSITATATEPPPAKTPPANATTHKIKKGETLSEIAALYGVTVQAIAEANGLQNTNTIITGQTLIIPAPGQTPPLAAPATQAPAPTTKAPAAPAPTQPPPPTPTQAASGFRYTGEILWDPLVAPNCSGPAISKHSLVRDANGNPIDGVRIEVDCYGNKWLSHPTGNPGEYEPGHYDFAFGQSTPQNWTCTARVFDADGQPVESSQTVTIEFDSNDCKPDGSGHQVAIVTWTRHW